MNSIVFATHNDFKLNEVRSMFNNNLNVKSLTDLNYYNDIPETGETLIENALIKARFVYNMFNVNCFSDDSGLEIQALNNAPGVYSARYAGCNRSPKDNIDKVLKELSVKSDRKAQFKTVIALIMNGNEYLFEGTIKGVITLSPIGGNGFAYDSIFKPNGYDKTFGELTPEIKNALSHRFIAINKLIKFLK